MDMGIKLGMIIAVTSIVLARGMTNAVTDIVLASTGIVMDTTEKENNHPDKAATETPRCVCKCQCKNCFSNAAVQAHQQAHTR